MQAAGSALIGRDRELAHLKGAIEDDSLVTITGVGGVGKTCLAQRVTADLGASFRDGAKVCELARERTGPGVPIAAANQLGFPWMEAAATALAEAEMLVLLDNCEHQP
jgi:predicted ATPase